MNSNYLIYRTPLNYLIRLWYSAYEMIKNRSIFKDVPLVGTAILGSLILCVSYTGLVTLILPEPPSFCDDYKMESALELGIAFVPLYLFNKRIGVRWLVKFADEDAISKKKRKKEYAAFMMVFLAFFVVSLFW